MKNKTLGYLLMSPAIIGIIIFLILRILESPIEFISFIICIIIALMFCIGLDKILE